MEPVTQAQLQAIYQRALADVVTARPHVAPEELHALVEHVGTEDARLRTLDHVMACGICREGFDLLRALQEAHGDLAEAVPLVASPSRAAGDSARIGGPGWMPMLVAASLIVAVGVTATRLREPPERVVETMRGSSSVPTALEPRGDMSSDEARRFVWQAVAGAVRYDVELLDSTGAMVHSASTADTTYMLPLSLALTNGARYQWFVSAQLPGSRRVVGAAERFIIR